jgi:adenylate cyclase
MSDADNSDEGAAALERALLGGSRRYTRQQVTERSGVPLDRAQRLWRALGFPDVDDDNVAFTDLDVQALQTVQGLVELGVIDEDTQLATTRAMGQTLSRLAEWQVSVLTTALTKMDEVSPDAAAEAARELVPVLEGLIGYVWRRHLSAAASRALANPDEVVARTMTVGFADLVGYTSWTRHADEEELARLLERFESVASDVIAQEGGRVVKTVGDEVMFVADNPEAGAEIALKICEMVEAADELPDVRVGVAYGTALARLGDIYGEPVNLASRLTSIARPGSILVDRELGNALEGNEKYRLRRVTPRPVRGYALLAPMRLRRADVDGAGQASD